MWKLDWARVPLPNSFGSDATGCYYCLNRAVRCHKKTFFNSHFGNDLQLVEPVM